MNPSSWRMLIREAAGTLKHKNAITPLSPVIILSGLCFWLAKGSQPPLTWALCGLGALGIVAFLTAYFYFMVKDPDRLHSEEFRTTSRALDIVESKTGHIEVNPVELREISNPDPTAKEALPSAEDEGAKP